MIYVSSLPLSQSSVRRLREKARKEHAESTRAEFAPDFPLVVHWDGKILPEISGLGEVDRLPVLVSEDGMEKLLGISKILLRHGRAGIQGCLYDLLEFCDA